MWKTVQTKEGIASPVQLIVDMKVRWSSTYLMLDRAERHKKVSMQDFSTTDIDNSIFYRLLTLLLMSYAGKRLMLRNVTKYVH
jgi:hypothetical protein